MLVSGRVHLVSLRQGPLFFLGRAVRHVRQWGGAPKWLSILWLESKSHNTFLVNDGDVLMPQIMIRNIKLSMILPFPGNYLIHLLRPANGETLSFHQMFPVVERKSITSKQNRTKPTFFYAKKCLMDWVLVDFPYVTTNRHIISMILYVVHKTCHTPLPTCNRGIINVLFGNSSLKTGVMIHHDMQKPKQVTNESEISSFFQVTSWSPKWKMEVTNNPWKGHLKPPFKRVTRKNLALKLTTHLHCWISPGKLVNRTTPPNMSRRWSSPNLEPSNFATWDESDPNIGGESWMEKPQHLEVWITKKHK